LAVSTNLIYGSLAVLPIFFLWLYIAWMLVLYAVLIVYVRHNIEHLTALERSHDIGRNDEMHLGLMAAIVFTQDSLVLNKEAAGLSATDIAAIIGAPPRDIREILSRLHKMHLIARVAGRDERFMLRVAPSQCTLGMVMNALDRAYLGINTYTGEKQFPIFSRLFAHNAFRLKSYRDISLLTVTEMNADILGKES
jgi:membrane protein